MIEPLEPRIAPAAVSVVGKAATWTDFDGDKVTMKWTSATAPAFLSVDAGTLGGLVVKRISFNSTQKGASVSITVKAAAGGDGRVDLGRVDATGIPLASWSSPRATISEIDAGDGTTSFKTFVSGGLGIQPVGLFPGAGGDGTSLLDGAVGSVTINGDIAATKLQISAPGGTKIASVAVKGSLLGTAPTSPANSGPSGVLDIIADEIGTLSITGSIIGGKGASTGILQNFGKIGTVLIKGSLVGGEAPNTGTINVGSVKSFTIGGNIQGGPASGTAKVGGLNIGSFTVGGNILGGSVANTAVIGFSTAKTVLVKGSIIGTSKLVSASNQLIAALSINGDAGSVTIGGDLLGGSNAPGTAVSYNGALIFGMNVKSLTIKGSVRGSDGLPAAILAKGATPTTSGNFNAIGKLTIGGDVTLAYIAAGHAADTTAIGNRIGTAENSDAGIGSVSVGGNWYHSSLTAGIDDAGSTGVDPTDTRATGDASRKAVIGSIAIKGDLLNSGAFAGTCGFAAEKIARLQVTGQTLFTTGAPAKSLNWDQTVFVRELV